MTRSDHPDAVRERARIGYDTVAENYAAALESQLDELPLEREILASFAALVGSGPVVELGSGPGHITAALAALGVDVRGVDLSGEMVRIARARHPRIRFDRGPMEELEASGLAGLVAWYSLIHVAPSRRPALFARFAGALRPGGHMLLGFQTGGEHRIVSHGYGHDVDVDVWRLDPDVIAAELAAAGFTVEPITVRPPQSTEATPQAFVLARTIEAAAPPPGFPANPQA